MANIMANCPKTSSVLSSRQTSWLSCYLLVVLIFLDLFSSVYSLDPKLQIDPPRENVRTWKLTPNGTPLKVTLRKPFNFNNQRIYDVWIHRDGFLSLGTPPTAGMNGYPLNDTVRSYTGLRHRLISVFMTRMNLSRSGTVRFRIVERSDRRNECRMQKALMRLEKEIKVLFRDALRIEQMLVVNWENVPPAYGRKDQVYNFEVALLSVGDQSYIVFNYMNTEFPKDYSRDPYPQSGVCDGSFHFSLPMSGSPTANQLSRGTNVATPGMWALKTGRLTTMGEFKAPSVKFVKDDLKAIRDEMGFGKIGSVPCEKETPSIRISRARRPKTCTDIRRLCHSYADCKNYNTGVCCKCKPGYFGNGYMCLPEVEYQMAIRGSIYINVSVNSLKFSGEGHLLCRIDRDSNGAIARMQYRPIQHNNDEVLYIAQSLFPLYITQAWFGAKSTKRGYNGFDLATNLSRYVTVDIKGLGVFSIHQKVYFTSEPSMETTVQGSVRLPTMKIPRFDFNKLQWDGQMSFKRVNSTSMVSAPVFRATLMYNGRPYPVAWTEEIFFNEACSNVNRAGFITLKTGRVSLYPSGNGFTYTTEDATVAEKPCGYPSVRCPNQKEKCIETSLTTHICVCKEGYMKGSDGRCVDVNECQTNTHSCNRDQDCVNTEGSYQCNCKRGFYQDGNRCRPISGYNKCLSGQHNCDKNADCISEGQNYRCQCRVGYFGDGRRCVPEDLPTNKNECRNCHKNASCTVTRANGQETCVCKPGYHGDGYFFCNPIDPDCSRNCEPPSVCVFGVCKCPIGMITGSSGKCETCNQLNNPQKCHRQADCVFNTHVNDYRCTCQGNLIGDGRTDCFKPCEKQCSKNGYCLPFGQCTCNPGLNNVYNDGTVCEPEDLCTNDLSCGQNQICKKEYDGVKRCSCKQGFNLKENQCIPSQDIRLVIQPVTRRSINEGDTSTFQCEVIGGSVPVHEIRWYKIEESIKREMGSQTFRSGIRVRPNTRNGIIALQLIINEARPEDAGAYRCKHSSGVKSENLYLNVKPDPCGRKCHSGAVCDEKEKQCKCRPNLVGDGVNSCIYKSCSNFPSMCPLYSYCKNDKCVCNAGFKEEEDNVKGTEYKKKCVRLPDCRKELQCHKEANCVYRNGFYQCVCRAGYKGSGFQCDKIKLGCNFLNKCAKNAECKYMKIYQKYMCKCKETFYGDGDVKCQKITTCTEYGINKCDKKAYCVEENYTDKLSYATSRIGVCRCIPGYTMVDQKCYKNESLNAIIFTSQEEFIIKTDVVQTKKTKPVLWYYNSGVSPPYGDIGKVLALATDCNQRKLFWSSYDVGNLGPSIYSAPYDKPTQPSVVMRTGGVLEGLAIDWISGNIFYTNTSVGGPSITVSNHNGSFVKVLVKHNITNPRGIAIDPKEGMVFWSDWDRNNPRIETAYMDGSERTILAQHLPYLPNGLTFDYDKKRLCWIGSAKQINQIYKTVITCVDPVSVNRFPNEVYSDNQGHPFGLAYYHLLDKATFYFTDWLSGNVQYVNDKDKKRKELNSSFRVSSGKYYGVAILPPKCPKGYSNKCSQLFRYGGCSFLCLPTRDGGRQCVCPDNDLKCKKGRLKS